MSDFERLLMLVIVNKTKGLVRSDIAYQYRKLLNQDYRFERPALALVDSLTSLGWIAKDGGRCYFITATGQYEMKNLKANVSSAINALL